MSSFETKWCPADWLDEIVPCLAKDPAELAVKGEGGSWILIDDIANLDDEEDGCRISLEPGQIVNFCAHRHYGSFLLTVHDDRSFTIDGPIPQDATHFALREADFEQMHDTIEHLVSYGDPESYNGFSGSPLAADQHQISAWFWSDEIPFRFDIEDGKPTFTRCAGLS